MKSAFAAHLPDEHFVIRVDGRVKSHHRRFLDALREGLQLRDQLLTGLPLGGFADFSYMRHLFSPDNFHSCGWLRFT
jgi:hypothetical protein